MALTAKKALAAAKKYTDEHGSSGTSDYEQLTNLPQIGGVELIGNKTASQLGLAPVDANGKVPAANLPSYVDDIIEGYLYEGHFYADAQHQTEITGESGKIYTDLSTNRTYRWSGSVFAEVSESLALGETSSTAFAGDRGKAIEDVIPSGTTSSNKLVPASALSGYVEVGDPITVDPGSDSVAGVTMSNDTSGNSTYYKIDGINAADTGFAINSAGDTTLYAEDDVHITAYDGDASIIAASGFTVTLNDEDVIDVGSGNMDLFNSEEEGNVNIHGALKVSDNIPNSNIEIKTFANDNDNGADILIKTDKKPDATGAAGDINITSLGGIDMASSGDTNISSNADLRLSMTYGENDFTIESANDLQLQGYGNNVVCNLQSDGGANFAGNITSPTISAITDNLGSKNLLKVTAETQTVNGVTFTVNRNAQGECTSISCSGTASGGYAYIDISYAISPSDYVSQIIPGCLSGKSYILSGRPSLSNDNVYICLVKCDSNGTYIGQLKQLTSDPVQIDLGSNECIRSAGILIGNGVNANGLVFYPMIRPVGTSADFVPYAPSNLEIGSAMSVDTSRNATFAANIIAEGTVTANGSDYAENFPALETCPVCRFVTLDGEKIRLAQPDDDYILGVVSENPAIIGDKDNPGTPVGLVGKLWVEHDGTAKVNGYVTCGNDGIATESEQYLCYRVMAVNGGKCRILVK